jgi:hypothetical protein
MVSDDYLYFYKFDDNLFPVLMNIISNKDFNQVLFKG